MGQPVRFAYVDSITQWWPPEAIATGMGVPGFAPLTLYTHIALAFWLTTGPADMALVWSNPVKYFGSDSQFGSTKSQIQKNLRARYNQHGMKIMVSAFGATEFPTTQGKDPRVTAQSLSKFVLQNQLDGVDIDWEDNAAMEKGTGEEWLIRFTSQLRANLPKHIITHAPQGPYFKKQAYKNGAYITVNSQVGNLIDFYNIQFYNQGNTRYDNYSELFIKSSGYFSGTSIAQIAARGVKLNKLIIGKPASPGDATNSGYVDPKVLGQLAVRGWKELGWCGGIMFWQFKSDSKGVLISQAAEQLNRECVRNQQ